MPFNGSGAYTAPVNSWNPAVSQSIIDPTDWNATQSDYETGISTMICRDGQSTLTNNIPFSGFKATGVNTNSGSTSRSEFASGATLQDGAPLDAGYTGGTSTAYTATLTPAIAAYADKQCFRVIFNAATGATPTIDFNAVGAKKIYQSVGGAATQITTNDIPANYPAILRYDSTLDSSAGAFWLVNAPSLNINGLTATTTVDAYTDKLPLYDASATANRSVIPAILLGLMQGYIYGLTLSNDGTDPTNDIGIAVGNATDNTSKVMMVLGSALIKQLDANWAAGTNQGMRYSGAAIANTTYHIWLVSTATGTTDIYATPSASAATPSAALTLLQAETGGASYVYIRRIGSILREGGAIAPFRQYNNLFYRDVPIRDVNATNPGTSAVSRTLSVPIGIKVEAIFTAAGTNTTTNFFVLLTSLDQTDTAASSSVFSLNVDTSTGGSTSRSAEFRRMTNTSAQIRSRQSNSGASDNFTIVTTGWVDTRDA